MAARVLLIEDNPVNLELARYLLSAFGHTVITADDGEQGLESARRESPELILCDLQLPGIDGFEVARQLKQHPALNRIPLVAVTALAMVGDREKVFAAGFDGYIPKPLDPQTFVAQVDVFLPAQLRVPAMSERAGPVAPDLQETARVECEARPVRGLVLVVDDSAENRALLCSILEPHGYRLLEARSAEEGLALASETRPDLIVSDLHMPRKSGVEFLHAVKADPALHAVPFVFLSSTAAYDADPGGADAYIVRPVDPRILLQQIEAYLKRKDTDGHDPDR